MSDHVVVIGGGPGGYEAALVAAQLGADGHRRRLRRPRRLGGAHRLRAQQDPDRHRRADDRGGRRRRARRAAAPTRGRRGDARSGRPGPVNRRVKKLAADQSADIARRLEKEGVRVVTGRGRLDGPDRVVVDAPTAARSARGRRRPGRDRRRAAHAAHRAAGRRADPDLGAGLRPRRGADRADRGRLRRHRRGVRLGVPRPSASRSPWSPRATGCCPARTPTRPRVLEDVLTRRGMNVLSQVADGVGRPATATSSPSRSPTAAPSRARTASWRSARSPTPPTSASRRPASVLDDGGFVNVDRVSRTSARGVYAAGDCTGVLMLASRGRHAGPDRDVALPRRRGHPARPQARSPPTSSPPPRSPPSAGRSRPSTPARSRPRR